MTTRTSTTPSAAPRSISREAKKNTAAAQGTSLNPATSYFAERRGKADWEAFDRLMNRAAGEPPRAGDELPQG